MAGTRRNERTTRPVGITIKTLKSALEALEFSKKVNYCWSCDTHHKYDRYQSAIEELERILENEFHR